MDKFQSGALALHYKVIGTGRPLLFLHGFLEDHSIWNTIYPVFEKDGFQCILVDLPGHGLSRMPEPGSIADVAGLLNNFLYTVHKAKETWVFGHSMGGYIGLELLRLRKLRLTLVHSNFWEDSPEKKSDRNRVIDVVKRNQRLFLSEAIPNLFAPQNRSKCAAIIAALIRQASTIPPDEIAAVTAAMRDRRSSYDLLERFNIHLIQGADDPVVPLTVLHSECSKLKIQPPVHLIPDCGHMSMWEQPQELINRLQAAVIE